ncbi:hypothetical protein GQ600_18902 [Phytophthora cactorum]|nr:hypothetical protein GQ600_18902 [Phytophthora cactorum]
MKKRPKNKNKTKLKGAEAYKSAPVVQVTTQLGVHRSSVYRWRKHAKALEANKKAGNKLLDYVAEIRKNRKLCVTTKCLILMMAKFDPAFVRARQYTALCSWTGRFLKRNHLVVRRITHKGNKSRSEMQNTGRCSVFLCGSATGEKLPPFVVFAGVPGCRVADSVTAPTFRSPAVEHIVQAKAWCDHSIMKEWIEKNDCATQVQYIPLD